MNNASILIAAQLKDPSVTDGMTLPDRSPMPVPTLGESTEEKPAPTQRPAAVP